MVSLWDLLNQSKVYARVILNPLIFFLCVQWDSKACYIKQIWKGISRVSHLFFANDSILFCWAKKEECQKILDILAIYERGSGQKINKDKTNILFSSNTTLDMKNRIQTILGVPTIRQYEKYIGLPTLVRRAKKQSLIYIKERVWKKLQGWKEKLLS